MKTNQILLKVYLFSNLMVGSVLLFICLLLGYELKMILVALAGTLVISAPAVLMLHGMFWLLQRLRIAGIAAWILLLASIPLVASVPAYLFVSAIPGDLLVLTGLGMISGYAGLFSQALSISELFNSIQYETE
jgi:hypothetical protein